MWKHCTSDFNYDHSSPSSTTITSPMPSSNPNDPGCQLISRKKRRGTIEKRRRDRINNSLNELRRLVPAAFEKQGSAKLEKAEILQMTVEHLRMLHAKGFDTFSFDPHKFAMDYHLIGFRECVSEVANYLLKYEGMDQDPIRLRLLSHLQCYSAQREISLKSSSSWNPTAFTNPSIPNPTSLPNPVLHPSNPSLHPVTSHVTTSAASTPTLPLHPSSHHSNGNTSSHPSQSHSTLISNAHSTLIPHGSHTQEYLEPLKTCSPSNYAQQYFPPYNMPPHPLNGPGVKYCRPWGTELAY